MKLNRMFRSYIICTSPRSGSTLLCRLLASTKKTGNPDSFYHREEFIREWASEWNLPDPGSLSKKDFDIAYMAAAITAGKAGTEIFGTRLQHAYLGLLSNTLDGIFPGLPSDAHRFERAFGKILYIHLTRADKVAQAVSLVKAEQSGLWHLNADGTEHERLSAPGEPYYDFASIHREVLALEGADRAWIAWFDRNEITPLRVKYEAFSSHPVQTLMSICSALGVEPLDTQTIQPGLAKLSDSLSLEWIQRYNADRATHLNQKLIST